MPTHNPNIIGRAILKGNDYLGGTETGKVVLKVLGAGHPQFYVEYFESAPKSGSDSQWFASVEMNRLQAHIFAYMLEINCTVARHYHLRGKFKTR